MKCGLARLYFIIVHVAIPASGKRLRQEKTGSFRGTPVEPKQALLAHMEEALGSEHPKMAEQQVREFELELEHTFKALPKNARGALTAPSVRYALHRLFNQRYGWRVKGLETGGGAWDSESPLVAMADHTPPGMRELFEERLGNYGLKLHELAVLAATMDNMFDKDVAARLRIVYDAYQMEESGILGRSTAIKIMIGYISSFILGPPVEKLRPEHVLLTVKRLSKGLTAARAEATKQLLYDIVDQIAGASDTFDLSTITSVLAMFGQKLGSLEDVECKRMKEKLVSREERKGNGRVRLGEFYNDDNQRMVHFNESPEYLRAHGMLDESSPDDPKVIIPNYLAGPSNCISPSGHYRICCFDDCESLMDKIEAHIGAPTASPEAIVSYVSSLASASQPANRTLSSELLRLLSDVAAHHGGQVPIHGRLFSQWMHQAYPRECNHPHVVSQSGVQSPTVRASAEVKQYHMKQADQMRLQVPGDDDAAEFTTEGLWTMHEELVDAETLVMHRARSSRAHDFCVLGVAGFVAAFLVKSLLDNKFKQTKKSKLL